MKAASEIKYQLRKYSEHAKGKYGLKTELDRIKETINVDEIYDGIHDEFQKAIDEKDYNAILRLYNRKSLPKQISSCLGLRHNELEELTTRLLISEKAPGIESAIKPYFENFFTYTRRVMGT